MSRITPRLAAVVVVALLSATVPGSGQPPQQKKAGKAEIKNVVMQKKLAQAQKLLEGLAIQDFDKITAAANELDDLRKQAAWMVVRTKEYEVFSMDFGRHTADLQRAAKNKNVDAAALAYIDMTMTCVKCHKYVREEKIAMAPVLPPDRAAE